jgi:hypothetical protein
MSVEAWRTTGAEQPHGQRLYERAGYVPIGGSFWGENRL